MTATPETQTIAELQEAYNALCRKYLTEKRPRRIKQLMSAMWTAIRETRRRDAGKTKVAVSHVNEYGKQVRETRFANGYDELKNYSDRTVQVKWEGHLYTLPGSKEVFHTEPPKDRTEYRATEAGPLRRADWKLKLSKKARRMAY